MPIWKLYQAAHKAGFDPHRVWRYRWLSFRGSSLRCLRSLRRINRFDKPPIIIGGCGRSGTTLLMSLLSSIPEVFVYPRESSVFCGPSRGQGLSRHDVDRLRARMMGHAIPETARRWCEKTPKNIHAFPDLMELFGDRVRLIHMVRDGRDVVTSRHPRTPDEYWVSPERWVADVSAGLELRGHPSVYTLRYEDLVERFSETIGPLCDFLDIPPDQRPSADWHDRATVRDNRAWFDGLQPIHNSSLRKWEKPEHAERVAEFMKHPGAADLLKELEYPLD